MSFSGKYNALRRQRLAKQLAQVQTSQPGTKQITPEKSSYLRLGALKDGDVLGALGDTVKDVRGDLMTGVLGIGEKAADAGAYLAGGVGKLFGAEDFADKTKEFISKDLYDEKAVADKILGVTSGLPDLVKTLKGEQPEYEEGSVLGDKTDALAQSGGQMLGTAALQMAGVPWQVTTGVTSFGSETENAFKQGATYGQAGLSGLISAGAEILTEKLFGGSGLGEKGLIDMDLLTKGISGKLARALTKFGLDMTTEGMEEVFSAFAGNLGSALYREEDLLDILWSEEAVDNYIDSFVSGMAMGGIANLPQAAGDAKAALAEKSGLAAAQQPQQAQPSTETSGSGITPSVQSAATQTLQTSQKPQKVDITEIMDEVVANATGAPADPVGAALEAFRTTGTVTDKAAAHIMNSVKAAQKLVEETGVKLPEDKAQRASVVKQAIADLAQKQVTPPVDAAAQTDYDNKNTQGGANYGSEQQQVDHGGVRWNPQGNSQGEAAPGAGNGSVYAGNGAQSRNLREKNRGTVYSADSEGRDLTQGGVKEQIRNSQEALSTMQPVTNIQVPAYFSQMDISSKKNWVIEKLRPTGYKVERKGFGIINFAAKQLKSAFNYFGKGSVEEAAFEAIPYVLENGIEISSHTQHKGRDYGTATIAAPVTINGDRGNMAVVVKRTTDNFYKVHRILTPDGSVFALSETTNEAESTPAGESPKTGSLATPKDSASADNIAQPGENVNTQNNTHPSPDESVGAAPSGFDPVTHLQYEYGTIPEGEKAVRPDDLPKSTDGKDRVSYTARTVKGAKVTPDEFVDLLNKDVVEGGLSYIPITNSATTQRAIDRITKDGWDTAKANWSADVRAGKTGADMSAVGALLLNNAAKAGDKAAWLEILHDYQSLGTNTAQGLQALRILKKLEPMDSLYMIRRSVDQLVDDMQVDVTLDEELLHEFENAKTDEDRDEALVKIQQNVADQIPSTALEKWTALRYVNMLGNLRTQVRNVAGNLGMKAVSSMKNAVAAALEHIAAAASGGKLERTKSFAVSKDLLQQCRSDFANIEGAILGGGKYADARSESSAFAQGVQNKRTIFKFKPLEGYRKVTGWATEKGDLVFSKSAYARALAGYLKAHGVSSVADADTALLDNARLYAIQEAQEQTFRDSNVLSDWISRVGRHKDTPAAVKAISEGVMPFRRTPANVLIRAEEYSPLGIINSVVTSVKAMQKDSTVSGAQVINSWAKSLTGTGIFGLGMLLSSLGLLSAGPDEDENKESFESLNGWQNYAVTLPDGTNFTIDFLTPSAATLLMGAQLMELIRDGGFTAKDLESALTSIADPMIEMSMLQGVNDTLDNIKYSEDNLMQFLISSGLSYLSQGLTNTLAGQIERTFEDSRMTTYVDKDSALPDWLQRFIGKASTKTLGLDYNQIPYINAWGEEEENPSPALGAVYNMLSPSYIEQGREDALTRELNRLSSAQGDVNVYPSTPDKTVTVGGQERNLSAEEYVALAKAQGKTAKRLVKDIIKSEYYGGLSDQQKAAAISYAYSYAREHARVETLEDYTGYSSKWMEGLDGDAAEAILRKVATGSTERFADLPIDSASYISDLLGSILPETGYSGTRYVQRVETITGSTLTEEQQKQIMGEILDDAAYEKYVKILDRGYSNDDYAAALRIYLDSEKTATRTKKEVTIQEFMDDLDLSRTEAEALYKLYSGT